MTRTLQKATSLKLPNKTVAKAGLDCLSPDPLGQPFLRAELCEFSPKWITDTNLLWARIQITCLHFQIFSSSLQNKRWRTHHKGGKEYNPEFVILYLLCFVFTLTFCASVCLIRSLCSMNFVSLPNRWCELRNSFNKILCVLVIWHLFGKCHSTDTL